MLWLGRQRIGKLYRKGIYNGGVESILYPDIYYNSECERDIFLLRELNITLEYGCLGFFVFIIHKVCVFRKSILKIYKNFEE